MSVTDRMSRSCMIFGEEGMRILASGKVLVFGIGGVGGYAIEALCRGGIGSVTIVDKDVVDESNMNRQIIADITTIGRKKTEVMKERIQKIAPDCDVSAVDCFYLPETADRFRLSDYDYVVDAIDTVTAKLELIERCRESRVPIISCMGTGNKTDPSMLMVDDLYHTSVCPLAKVMRKECKNRNIDHLKVVYSKENPINVGQRTPGSASFVPGVAGMLMAGEVIKDIIRNKSK